MGKPEGWKHRLHRSSRRIVTVFLHYFGYNFMYYIEADGKILQASFLQWAEMFDNTDRQIKYTKFEDPLYEVSTVFIGIDHNFATGGKPLVYETLVTTSTDEFMWRWSSRQDAIYNHDALVRRYVPNNAIIDIEIYE